MSSNQVTIRNELPIASILAAILVLLPTPWHWRAGNVATMSMVAWLFAVNVVYAVDSLIWRDNVTKIALIWCDITTKVLIGANIALPAACMCVCIHLEQVASVRNAFTTVAQKRRRQIIEAVLCYLVPLLWMGLHYIVQGHRFDIIQQFGCRPSVYVSIPAVFLMWVPSLIMAFISLVFALLAFSHFMRRRITFSKHLENSKSGLTSSRYFRLMLLAIFQMFASTAAVSATLGFSVVWDMRPWTNWDDVHSDFGRIDAFPTVFLPPFIYQFYYACWWIPPVSAYVFCLFFSFGQEAMNEYRSWAMWVWRNVFRQRSKTQTQSLKASAGGFVPMPPSSTHSSFCVGHHISITPLPPIHISNGELGLPSPASFPTTPVDHIDKKQSSSDHSKADTSVIAGGDDDDLPSYYSPSLGLYSYPRPTSSVQTVPSDIDLSEELGPHAV